MEQTTNPMGTFYQSQLEASRRIANVIFTGTEKLDRLVLEATHQMLNDQLALAQAMTSGRNRAGGISIAGSLMRRNSDGAVNYQAEIIRVVAEMQTELGRSMQEYIEQVGLQASAARQQAGKTAQGVPPAASDTLLNPMTSLFSLWESAFKEATSIAGRSMAAMQSNTERAAETAQDYAHGAARAGEQAAEGGTDTARKAAGEAGDRPSPRRR